MLFNSMVGGRRPTSAYLLDTQEVNGNLLGDMNFGELQSDLLAKKMNKVNRKMPLLDKKRFFHFQAGQFYRQKRNIYFSDRVLSAIQSSSKLADEPLQGCNDTFLFILKRGKEEEDENIQALQKMFAANQMNFPNLTILKVFEISVNVCLKAVLHLRIDSLQFKDLISGLDFVERVIPISPDNTYVVCLFGQACTVRHFDFFSFLKMHVDRSKEAFPQMVTKCVILEHQRRNS